MDKLNRLEMDLKKRLVAYKMKKEEAQEKENGRLEAFYEGLELGMSHCLNLIEIEKITINKD